MAVTLSGPLTTEPLDFDCPRCDAPVKEKFYGPCEACVDQLRATIGLDRKAVAAEEYVPKMNVTPNAVASKE